MKPKTSESGWRSRSFRCLIVVLSVAFLSAGSPLVFAQETQPQTSPPAPTAPAPPAEEAPKIPNDQLDSLVSPIALYPDPLLAQTLAASTYPLEIIQLQQWLGKNPTLKGKALTDAVLKQNWDPSIQAMAALPDVVKLLADSIAWTSDLGNAFLAQQTDVMDAVQRMRTKAQGAGNLKTSKEQKVESKQVEGKTVVVIEQADPQVVYVPSYNPTAVYGPPIYPYPSVYYPTGRLLAFGAGVAIGAAWGNGGWGYGCGWGNNNVNVNVNNNFVNNYNKTNVNNRISNNSNWQHNGQHRGGAPYSNRTTANKYGGTTRGDSPANRQSNARQNAPNRPNTMDRPNSANRPNRDQGPGNNKIGGGNTNRSMDRSPGGGDSIGNRQVSRSPSARNTSAFGSGGGMDRSSARASSSRGSQSMSSSRGGGQSRGGGSRGGGRSGGGRRR
jgi:uncharacterized membrane protein YgcG